MLSQALVGAGLSLKAAESPPPPPGPGWIIKYSNTQPNSEMVSNPK